MPYRIHYLRQDWSREYEMKVDPVDGSNTIVTHPTGEVTIDCGTWSSVEEFTEGVLPGTYLFTPYRDDFGTGLSARPEETFVVVIGHPDLPDPCRVAGDVL